MRVCVIGAGAGGLGVAHYLNKNGIEHVTVLEVADRVGGKCCTIVDNGQAYDMGAIEITPSYSETLSLIDEFQLSDTLVDIPSTVVIDRKTGQEQPFPGALYTAEELKELPSQMLLFVNKLKTFSEWMERPGLYDAPSELRCVTFQSWLESIGAPLVGRMYWVYIDCFGYGSVEKIPAIYGVKFTSVMDFASAAHRLSLHSYLPDDIKTNSPPKNVVMLKDGYGNLMNQIANSLGDRVKLGARIINIKRESNLVKVKYKVKDGEDNNGEHVIDEEFDFLVISVAPAKNNLNFLDLNQTERKLFSSVYTTTYATTLKTPTDFSYYQYVELMNKGNPEEPTPKGVVQFAKLWNNASSNCIFWTDGGSKNMSVIQVEKYVDENIRQIGHGVGKSIATKIWEYFPQVSLHDLFPDHGNEKASSTVENDFYNQLESIQGMSSTFYCGGLLNFELVETTLRYSKRIAESIKK